MPTLRKLVSSPGSYLTILALAGCVVSVDAGREPKRQLLARTYVAAVQEYQHWGRPILEGHVRCRYDPHCSEYSIEAVRRYGLIEGLALTVHRIARCRQSVPLGTRDPVPEGEEA